MYIDVRLLFLLVSITVTATCHRQNRLSKQSVQKFQSPKILPHRSWLQVWGRKIGKSGYAIEDSEVTDLNRLTEKRIPTTFYRKLKSVVKSGVNTNSTWKSRQSVTTTSPLDTTTNATVSITTNVLPACIAAAAAMAIAVAVGVAVPTSLQLTNQDATNSQDAAQQINLQNLFGGGGGGLVDNQTPTNNLPLPVNGTEFPDDGCGDGSVRFVDGNCYSVLRRGPCVDPHHWLTVDPIQLHGRCTPRLCGRGRVFVGRDGLCHDVNDPLECRGGRRLYYSAYGDSICDCPIGHYPFPNAQDDCVPLFTQGPCPARHVVNVSPEGSLGCAPTQCQSIDGEVESLQLVPTAKACYPLGSRGPCPNNSQLLGYDIFKRQLQCVNIQDPSSPYFFSSQEDEFLDSVYNQIHPEYDDFRVFLVGQRLVERNDTAQPKQDTNTLGVFQVPAALPDSILNPCRPGARRGLNYKCSNPLVSNLKGRELLQVVRSAFNCPTNSFLQATGQCVNDKKETSCGPSYRFNSITMQCRPIF